MEKSEVISINSCALDLTLEEFNKKDLQEAGVLIDYDSDTELEINSNKGCKKRPRGSRWIFLGILMVLLFIVMSVGFTLIEHQEKTVSSNTTMIETVYLMEEK